MRVFQVLEFFESQAPKSLALSSSPKHSKNTVASFTAGLWASAVLTDADRMIPLAPGNIPITRDNLFSCRRIYLSISHTRSPTLSTRSSSVAHLECTFLFGTYYFGHLFQIIWLYAWATLFILQQSTYLTASGIKRSANTARSNRKWLGVYASRSSGSSLTRVKGLPFSFCLTKHIVVASTGNVIHRFPRLANMALLQLRTSLSKIPPNFGAPGGFNF